jgi:hypothetical protein
MELTEETVSYGVYDDQKEQWEANEAYLTKDPGKLRVECICPKCQQKHSMPLHWIGRGTPRKFCNRCRDWAESAVT